VPLTLQLFADAFEIVQLTVGDDVEAMVLVRDGLITRLEIDDAEPRVTEAGAAVRRPVVLRIGPTMSQRLRAACDRVGADAAVFRHCRNNSTHSPMIDRVGGASRERAIRNA